MSDNIERFKRRKEIMLKNKGQPLIAGPTDQLHVERLLDQGVDQNKLDALKTIVSTELSNNLSAVDPADVDAILSELSHSFDRKNLTELLDHTKGEIISTFANAFGIGKLLSVSEKLGDKEGGNVTTIHNANNGVYANDADRYARKNYDETKNSKGQKFKGKIDKNNKGKKIGQESAGSQFTRSKKDENGMVEDAYTGKWHDSSNTSPDHIYSLSQYHKDGGFMQSDTQKADFATDPNNLALTERTINQSLSDSDKIEWAEKIRENGKTNKEHFNIDETKLQQQVQKGNETASKHLPTGTEKTIYYAKNAAATGIAEGGKMGVQQALGMLSVELLTSCIVEVKSVCLDGMESDGFVREVTIRFSRIGKQMLAKWDDVVYGFAEGFISGFISNIVTTLINLFATTAKRAVRMIREGFFSLLKAIKIMLFPPENMSKQEAAHEALKLIAAGGVLIGGIALEEVIDKLLTGIPFSALLSSLLVGALTAITMSLVVYLIDKMDLFGAKQNEKNAYISDRLDCEINNKLISLEKITAECENMLLF